MKTHRNSFLLLFLAILFFLPATGQVMTVESMVPKPSDGTANLPGNLYEDNNGEYGGLVKVMLDASDATFEGWVLNHQVHGPGEFWVFMAKGSSRLTVNVPGYLPLNVSFRDYKDCVIKSRQTYELTITLPPLDNASDMTTGVLDVQVTPMNSSVYVDGRKIGASPNVFRNIQAGDHLVEVRMEGYDPLEKTVTIRENEQTAITGNLTRSVTDELSCPDDRHPHMIDLGLPSGTKWACCNVGAQKPEDFGGYYAWGETETKSEYNSENYVHSETFLGLDENICGTQYDVATVKWGDAWQMPTENQFWELKSYCTRTQITKNGVEGIKLTAKKNGNSIFLPYAGYAPSSELRRKEFGRYWTGEKSDFEQKPYYISIKGTLVLVSTTVEVVGLTVRPVAK